MARRTRRSAPWSSNRNLSKWRSGTNAQGFFKRRMYSPAINLNTPNLLRMQRAKAQRLAQIASAKKRRLLLSRALKLALKFRPRTPKKKPRKALFGRK